jgi:hypothetical protein
VTTKFNIQLQLQLHFLNGKEKRLVILRQSAEIRLLSLKPGFPPFHPRKLSLQSTSHIALNSLGQDQAMGWSKTLSFRPLLAGTDTNKTPTIEDQK